MNGLAWGARLPNGNANGDIENDEYFTYNYIVDLKESTDRFPNGFILHQNYPNPFNPVTNIDYGIPEAGFVHLVVYDILGRQVSELVYEFQSAGKHNVIFNAYNLSSGVYFLNLR
ncbi:MAG: T9SS type A sorting domain-containing protein [Bacteroidetes bacterium]|nr:T9SS type A sorting domain-containing protein [Bacteroidota bacterium]